ncbi:MAG: hypothetical protein KFF73_08640 [Cyclobacteriaceae bacterium]|nr:hypothetical protein [Cyclobacteriaceae bacterium]
MKYLKLLIPGSLLGFLLLISCDYIEVRAPDMADTVKISVTANIVKAEVTFNEWLSDEYYPSWLEGTGRLNGINIDGNQFLFDCSINMSHVAWYDEYHNIRIEEGKFSMKCDQGGDFLQGYYTGGGRDEGNGLEIRLILTITGGTGQFQQANGTLSAEWLPAWDNRAEDLIRYKGMILLPEDKYLAE